VQFFVAYLKEKLALADEKPFILMVMVMQRRAALLRPYCVIDAQHAVSIGRGYFATELVATEDKRLAEAVAACSYVNDSEM
jgi:hypothetical protein